MARAQSKVNGLIINYNQFTHTAVKLGQGKFAEVTRNPIPSEHFQPDYKDEDNQEETHDIPEVKPPKSGKGKKALPKEEPPEIPEEEAEQPEEL